MYRSWIRAKRGSGDVRILAVLGSGLRAIQHYLVDGALKGTLGN